MDTYLDDGSEDLFLNDEIISGATTSFEPSNTTESEEEATFDPIIEEPFEPNEESEVV